MTISVNQSSAISFLRVISVIFIVACHILQAYENKWAWVFNIGVPIFFIISGYLYGKKHIDNPVKWFLKRGIKILSPFYIYLFVVLTIKSFVFDTQITTKNLICYILDLQGIGGGISGLNHLWFLTWIMICYFLSPILQAIENKKNIIIYIFLFAILFLGVQWNHRFYYVVLYTLSYIISKRELECNRIILAIIVVFAIFTLAFFNWNLLLNNTKLYRIWFHLSISSLIFFSILAISVSYKGIIGTNRLMTLVDKFSYEIYIVHHLIILGPLSMLFFYESQVFNLIQVIVLVCIQAVVLKYISKRLETFLTFRLDNSDFINKL